MLKIVITDRTAEARNRLSDEVQRLLSGNIRDVELMPRISVQPLSIEELKFNAAPDICIIGEGIILHDLTEVRNIRKLLPDTPLLVQVGEAHDSLSIVEQLARMGADDTISSQTSSADFYRKVVLLSRRAAAAKTGKLILIDAGKGGTGVTTIAAALGEALVDEGRRVAVLDFDYETQDLSRFLQARPFINENLQLLIDQNRPVTQEFVEQALTPVWADDDLFYCMPPSPETEDLYDARSSHARTMVSILEILDSSFDGVIVDVGSARGALLRTLYRVADKVVFVVNNDPASLYASVDKITKVRGWMSAGAELLILDNGSQKGGLSNALLRQEFGNATKLVPEQFLEPLPFVKQGSRWPGSGGTFFSASGSKVRKQVRELLQRLALIDGPEQVASRSSEEFLTSLAKKMFGSQKKLKSQAVFHISSDTSKLLPKPSEPELALEAPKLITAPGISSVSAEGHGEAGPEIIPAPLEGVTELEENTVDGRVLVTSAHVS